MSTLGKVLVILVVLALLGWIFLAALVADHHINWSQRLDQIEKEVAALQADLPPIKAEIYTLTREADVLQVGLERFRRNFRAEIAMKQKEESDTKEALSRSEFQLKTVQLEVIAAQKRHDIRRQEKLDFDKQILQLQAAVQDQMAENKKLKEEYQGLQKAFLTTLAENREYVNRLNKKAAATTPRTRLGSLVR